jgi:hypothetical protein
MNMNRPWVCCSLSLLHDRRNHHLIPLSDTESKDIGTPYYCHDTLPLTMRFPKHPDSGRLADPQILTLESVNASALQRATRRQLYRSLRYAHVNHNSLDNGERAHEELNYTVINSNPCHIMRSPARPRSMQDWSGQCFYQEPKPRH